MNGVATRPAKVNEHYRLTDAGWPYRTNADRGWTIYRDPETGLWHTKESAMQILEGKQK